MSQVISSGYAILTNDGIVVTLEEYTRKVREELIEESVKQTQGQGLKSWIRSVMTRAMEEAEAHDIEKAKEARK